ncbi:MAG: acetoin dehydrogenase dihydrolipoyllysine-residue acetyltransferase subunit, partial [Burkholderiales bacterium]|nr:acetoin dehydrogenase dihydrolipoyllysine-residue acetyltransferase subunit [Burkholderiales bacterium]
MALQSPQGITPIVMPKWGLEMREGTIAGWLVEEGTRIAVGQPILEVETDKISNAVEAPDPGLLRRRVAQPGETLAVKALLGVLAEAAVSDAEIDAYVAAYEVPAADAGADEAATYTWTAVNGIRVRHARRGAGSGVP